MAHIHHAMTGSLDARHSSSNWLSNNSWATLTCRRKRDKSLSKSLSRILPGGQRVPVHGGHRIYSFAPLTPYARSRNRLFASSETAFSPTEVRVHQLFHERFPSICPPRFPSFLGTLNLHINRCCTVQSIFPPMTSAPIQQGRTPSTSTQRECAHGLTTFNITHQIELCLRNISRGIVNVKPNKIQTFQSNLSQNISLLLGYIWIIERCLRSRCE